MTSKIPAKRKFGDVNTVTLFVGASRTAFHVHEDALCTASAVFKAAFESKFKESTERTMELPEEDADLVELFVSWLYRKTLPDVSEVSAPDPAQERLMRNARLFQFAEQWDVEALQASICGDIFNIAGDWDKELPSFVVLEFIYANTHRKATIRIIIADWFACTDTGRWQAKGEGSDGASTDWLYNIPEFGVDLALAFVYKSRAPIPLRGSKLPYLQNLQKRSGKLT